jgi:hypothetical protein
MTMSNHPQTAVALDDSALASVHGGNQNPPPPRVLPLDPEGRWIRDPDMMGELNRAGEQSYREDMRNLQEFFNSQRDRWRERYPV